MGNSIFKITKILGEYVMKLFNYAIFIFFIYVNMFSQNVGIMQSADLTQNSHRTVKVYNYSYYAGGSSSGLSNDYAYDAGRNDYQVWNSDSHGYDHYNNEWISSFGFHLSIPANAILEKIEISVTGNSGSITELPVDIATYSDEDFFNAVGNASSLFDYPITGYQDITDYASQFLSNGVFYVGTRSNASPNNVTLSARVWYEIPAHVSFQNNMGGQFSVNNANKTGSFSDDYWLNTNVALSLTEPQYTTNPNYTWIWNDTEAPSNPSKWEKIKSGNVVSSRIDQSFSFAVTSDDHQATYKANMKKKCNVTFQNSLPEGGNTGNVIVDGTSYSVTKTEQKVEGNSVSFSAPSQSPTNGIYPIFDHWSDGSTSSSRTATINAHITFIAYYKGKASATNRHLSIDTTIGQPIKLIWDEHPCTNVTQYRIYRRVKPAGGTTGPETLIATVNRGTTTYTDNSYTLSNLYYYLISYDVRFVYSGQCDGVNYTTETDPYYISTFANTDLNPSTTDNSSIQQTKAKEIPDGYAVTNYPNPFNPTTVINYQLPTDGMVTLKVYDVLGKEVAALVNDHRTAGYYSVEFNASNLPSGIYICTITANNFTQSKKMLLMK